MTISRWLATPIMPLTAIAGVNLREVSTGERRENGRNRRAVEPHTLDIAHLYEGGRMRQLKETRGFREVPGPEAVNIIRGSSNN